MNTLTVLLLSNKNLTVYDYTGYYNIQNSCNIISTTRRWNKLYVLLPPIYTSINVMWYMYIHISLVADTCVDWTAVRTVNIVLYFYSS